MKRVILLLMLVISHYTSFSQALRPLIKDSLFCFNIKQSKQIALYINNSLYCDTIIAEKDKIISMQANVLSLDSSMINKQAKIIDNCYLTIDNTNKINDLLLKREKALNKEIRRQKQQKNLLGLAAIIIGVVAIVR